MKKIELLKIKPLLATEQMKIMVHEDKGEKIHTNYSWGRSLDYEVYKHYLYFRATIENEILKVAVFTRQRIALGEIKPKYEIYLSKAENRFITYETASGRWLNAKIDMLELREDSGYSSGSNPYAIESDEKAVCEFFGYRKTEIQEAILDFQFKIRRDDLKSKHRRETDEIDEQMNKVPALPKDFSSWVENYGLYNSRYIFYHAGKKVTEGYCSHCHQTVPVKEPRRNMEGTCKKCRSKIIFKPWNGQKYITDEERLAIIQELKDASGFVIREFHTRKSYRIAKGWDKPEVWFHEYSRKILSKQFLGRSTYEWGEFKQSGITRWCYNVNHGGYSYYYAPSEERILYQKNIKEIRLLSPELKYMPLEDVIKNRQGKRVRVSDFFFFATKRPYAEYLIKAKLYNLAVECLKSNELPVDKQAKKPWDFLKVTKEQFKICTEINANRKELGVIWQANKYNRPITKQQIQWIAKYSELDLIRETQHTTIHKMVRYFKEQLKAEKNEHAWRDYDDYISMAQKCGYDIKDEATIFPQNFKQAHDNIALELAEKEEKELQAQERKKNREYKKLLKGIKELYQFESKDFQIVVPETKSDFRKEGHANHNCVGGMYFERVLAGNSIVVFLRKKESLETSFCTVELKEDKLLQCRADHNASPPEEVNKFMERYTKEIKQRLEKKKEKVG